MKLGQHNEKGHVLFCRLKPFSFPTAGGDMVPLTPAVNQESKVKKKSTFSPPSPAQCLSKYTETLQCVLGKPKTYRLSSCLIQKDTKEPNQKHIPINLQKARVKHSKPSGLSPCPVNTSPRRLWRWRRIEEKTEIGICHHRPTGKQADGQTGRQAGTISLLADKVQAT